MNNKLCTRRLINEYKKIDNNTEPGISYYPNDKNINECHFILSCEHSPYAGGEYYGIITIPPNYPHNSPSFKMLTPSGRFELGKPICPELEGHPTLTLIKYLIWLQSIMYEESNTIGSLNISLAERRRLAIASHDFNGTNYKDWNEIKNKFEILKE